MVKFLDGRAANEEIKRVLRNANWARVAVAYWGDGATRRLGMMSNVPADIEIICDARNGGCNPSELRRLRKLIGVDRVLTCDQLHAKMWLTDKAAIIGSSNASANGLGYEGDETSGLIEANVLVDDPDTLICINNWYKEAVHSKARPIDDADLRRASRLRKGRRPSRPLPDGTSLLDIVRRSPEALSDRNLLVWVWRHDQNPDKWAEVLAKEQKKERRNPKIDWYQGTKASDGAYILDFDSSTDPVSYIGMYKILEDNSIIRDQNGRGHIQLCLPVSVYHDYKLGDQTAWEQAATRAANASQGFEWEGDVASFAKKFLL